MNFITGMKINRAQKRPTLYILEFHFNIFDLQFYDTFHMLKTELLN